MAHVAVATNIEVVSQTQLGDAMKICTSSSGRASRSSTMVMTVGCQALFASLAPGFLWHEEAKWATLYCVLYLLRIIPIPRVTYYRIIGRRGGGVPVLCIIRINIILNIIPYYVLANPALSFMLCLAGVSFFASRLLWLHLSQIFMC